MEESKSTSRKSVKSQMPSPLILAGRKNKEVSSSETLESINAEKISINSIMELLQHRSLIANHLLYVSPLNLCYCSKSSLGRLYSNINNVNPYFHTKYPHQSHPPKSYQKQQIHPSCKSIRSQVSNIRDKHQLGNNFYKAQESIHN